MFVHKDHIGSVQYISDENRDLSLETGIIAFTTGAIAGFAGGITVGTVLGVFGGSALSCMLSGSLTYSLTVGITTLGNYAFLGTMLMSGRDFLFGLGVSAMTGAVFGAIEVDMAPDEQVSPASDPPVGEEIRDPLNDQQLQEQAGKEANMNVGHRGLRSLTTNAPAGDGSFIDSHGMINTPNPDGSFSPINACTRVSKGSVFWGMRSDVYISPGITKFHKWTTGTLLHENVHVIQNFYLMHLSHTLNWLEQAAYIKELNYYYNQLALLQNDEWIKRYCR
jgi:hypothetical protein